MATSMHARLARMEEIRPGALKVGMDADILGVPGDGRRMDAA